MPNYEAVPLEICASCKSNSSARCSPELRKVARNGKSFEKGVRIEEGMRSIDQELAMSLHHGARV